MRSKVVAGLIWAAIGITILCFQFTPLMGIFIIFFSVISNYEILRTAQVKNKQIIILSGVVAAIIPPSIEYGLLDSFPLPVYALIFAYLFLLMVFMLARYSVTRFEHVAIAFVTSIFIPCSISSMMLMRDMYIVTNSNPYTKSNCTFMVIFALLCAWMTDAMAYFFGRKFGKHKMAPNISPKKSWEGAVGGVIGNVGVSLIVWVIYQLLAVKGIITPLFIPAWFVAVASVILSVIAMLGDLSASAIKRNYGIKDFGTIMGKGNGGAMDRFDSAVFVLPAAYGIVMIYEFIR